MFQILIFLRHKMKESYRSLNGSSKQRLEMLYIQKGLGHVFKMSKYLSGLHHNMSPQRVFFSQHSRSDHCSDTIQFPWCSSGCLWRRAWLSACSFLFTWLHVHTDVGCPPITSTQFFSRTVFLVTFFTSTPSDCSGSCRVWHTYFHMSS